MGSSQRHVESWLRICASKLCAMTIVNSDSHSLSFASTSSRLRRSALPSTPSLSSPNNLTASSALDLPILDDPSKKKLLPASSPVTLAGSRMVKWPMPGNTRFFRADVDVAVPDITRMRDDSRAFCPDAAHRLKSKILAKKPRINIQLTAADDRSVSFCYLVHLYSGGR